MTNQRPAAPPIPVTILAGFLGSGKTTLLNRILTAEHGLRIAVLVNDFGIINIDTQLLEGDKASEMISLPNGCICCTLFGNLVDVLHNLSQLSQPPEHILIEASGVSQPDQIAGILQAGKLQDRLRLDSIITLVDASYVRRLAQVVIFIEKQLAAADLILLNKIDLVEPETAAELIDWIRDQAPAARIIPTSFADAPLELLLSVGRGDALSAFSLHDTHDGHADHAHAYDTWVYISDKRHDRQALQRALEALPPTVYRGKGFVQLDDVQDQRVVLQMVGKRVELAVEGNWGADPPRTQLVFIGAPDALSNEQLQRILDDCAAPVDLQAPVSRQT